MANQPFKMFSFQSQDPKIEDSDEKNNQESEEQQRNQTFLMIWNTKPNPNYKLQFYNYYSDQVGIEFSLKTYNKFTTYHNPKLKHYLRFSSKLIPDQIEATKNLFYNSFMSDPYESQIIMKPYIGQYSQQSDYHFFKRS
ncbi:unnamed protein product [Paramecium pentaurelia]|uniref:Uncharacterized protein n=1 Tax=Paramecium pentaurelia TaxID=43138 RepID=A0A8S1WZ62_9CILI|nr:unnamed protein product [Paramecium pentaurelia]